MKQRWRQLNVLIQNKKSHSEKIEIKNTEFLTHYKGILSAHTTVSPSTYKHTFIDNTASLYHCTENEILGYFNSFKDKHTRQTNDIPMFLWRKICETVVSPLTCLVNQMIDSASFPDSLKHADIIPIFKKGARDNPANFRPVANLHNLSKIFENVILHRIKIFAEKENILPENQFGFRKGHSTKDAVMTLFLEIEKNVTQGFKTCCIFLDFSKAFDCVNHRKLLSILSNFGFRGHFHTLIKSYLQDRNFRIKSNNSFSNYSPILNGVPQGSALSPLLYSIYVAEFSKISTNIIQYADDTTILIRYTDLIQLQREIIRIGDNILSYLKTLGLVLNSTKTDILLFGEKHIHSLNFLNASIESKTETKFLGIQVSTTKNFDFHILRTIIPNIRKLFPVFSFISKYLVKHSLPHIFKAFIYPHILYALPFILNSHQVIMHKLSRTFNQGLKILFRLPFMYPSQKLPLKTHIPCLSSLIQKHVLSYAYLIYHKQAPKLPSSYFTRSTRNKFILKGPKTQLSLHNKIASSWNQLPNNIKSSNSHSIFKKNIKSLYCV